MTPDLVLVQRAQWEKGLTPVYLRDETNTERRVLVVLAKPRSNRFPIFHCHRYFILGNDWGTSVDGQDVPLEAVWAWLMNPCAASTCPPFKRLTKVEE